MLSSCPGRWPSSSSFPDVTLWLGTCISWVLLLGETLQTLHEQLAFAILSLCVFCSSVRVPGPSLSCSSAAYLFKPWVSCWKPGTSQSLTYGSQCCVAGMSAFDRSRQGNCLDLHILLTISVLLLRASPPPLHLGDQRAPRHPSPPSCLSFSSAFPFLPPHQLARCAAPRHKQLAAGLPPHVPLAQLQPLSACETAGWCLLHVPPFHPPWLLFPFPHQPGHQPLPLGHPKTSVAEAKARRCLFIPNLRKRGCETAFLHLSCPILLPAKWDDDDIVGLG